MTVYNGRLIKGIDKINNGDVVAFNSKIDFGYSADGVAGPEISLTIKNYTNSAVSVGTETYTGNLVSGDVEWTDYPSSIPANSSYVFKVRLPSTKSQDQFYGSCNITFSDSYEVNIWMDGIRVVGALELTDASIDVGVIGFTTWVFPEITNNKSTQDTITGYSITPADGTITFDVDPTGTVIPRNSVRNWHVNVSSFGVSPFSSVITFNFLSGDSLDYTITGERTTGDFILSPETMNIGHIKSNLSYDFTIKNDDINVKTISSITYNNLSDVSITGMSVGTSFDALETLSGTVEILSTVNSGELFINGNIQITFSDGSSVYIYITGTRGLIFCRYPDERYIEGYKWETEVFIADDGTESRYVISDSKRRFATMSFSENYAGVKELENIMFNGVESLFLIPLWKDKSALTANALAADTVIYCDTTISDFEPTLLASIVFVVDSLGNFSYHEIDTINSTNIVLSTGLNRDFPIGSWALPVIYASLERDVKFVHDGLGRCKGLTFKFTEEQ